MNAEHRAAILNLQAARNRGSRDGWQAFASHRSRIQAILADAIQARMASFPAAARRLTVLGAGNCNDLHLSWLLDAFDSIQLVDLDRPAIEEGIRRQFSGSDTHGSRNHLEKIEIVAPHDFSGLNEALHLAQAHAAAATANSLEAAIRLPGPLSQVILSSCVFSQIVEAAVTTTAGTNIDLTDFIQRLRRYHISSMIQALEPSGVGVLVTDFCSAVTWPGLATIPDQDLPAAAAQQINLRNFFTGTNPAAVRQLLVSDPEFRTLVVGVKLHPPWKWHLGNNTFAVYAIQFSRLSPGCKTLE